MILPFQMRKPKGRNDQQIAHTQLVIAMERNRTLAFWLLHCCAHEAIDLMESAVEMGNKRKYLIAMEVHVRKDDSSAIDGMTQEAFASPWRIEAH